MGLFNRKQKTQETQEIENEFNYDKMLKEAKLYNIFDDGKLYNIINTQNGYEKSNEKTGLIGVYNKNYKLIIVLKYNLEQNILFDYLLRCGNNLKYIFDNIEILPVTIEEKYETLLSNYSDSKILECIKIINEPNCVDELCPYTGMFKKSTDVGGNYLECTIYKTLKFNNQ